MKRLRNCLVITAMASTIPLGQGHAQVYGQGVAMTDSCGAFVSAVQKNDPGEEWVMPDGTHYATMAYLYMTWVAGYLTAENMHRTQERQIRVDRDGLAGWLKIYCEKHPAQTIQQAVYAMAHEL